MADGSRALPRLQEELRQSRPFPSTAVEAVLALQRTSDLLAAEFTRALRPLGVTATQYNVLRILRGAGAEGLPTLEVGARLVTREPDVPRLIDRLEKAGLVHRARCPIDRRVVRCRLTEAGAALLAQADPVAEGLPARQLAMLSAEEQAQLVTLLARIRARDDR